MSFFLRWLGSRIGLLAAFGLFGGIFAAVFWLYGLPLAALGYPFGLCGVLGLLFLGADCAAAHRRWSALAALSTPDAALLDPLPSGGGPAEQEYRRLLELARREQRRRTAQDAARYHAMTEYYTLWAHQIKIPIASMQLQLQSEDTPLARQLRADLVRCEQYVEMALVYLRLDSDSTDYLFQRCELDEIVRPAVRRFAGEFIRRHLRLEYEPLRAQAVTDRKWLGFVVEQVLSNALKYTPAGGSVSITLEAPLTLCIRDTGIGIAPEDLPRIFDRGYTGWTGRTERQASGIGLYLCRKVCRRLGHGISAESAPGKGTCIRIALERRELPVE